MTQQEKLQSELRHLWYILRRPYWSLKRWIKLQRDIYSIPREARPTYWAIQQAIAIEKAQITYDLGTIIYGGWIRPGTEKEFIGLDAIVDDGVSITALPEDTELKRVSYDRMIKTTFSKDKP